MLTFIDKYLNKITMYKLVQYVLFALVAIASVFGFLGKLPFSGISILFSALVFIGACAVLNFFFAWIFKAHTNVESVYITALILALIITPLRSYHDVSYWSIALWASGIAMASKYIIAIGKKHIFNPAAFAVAITALVFGYSASWWVGTAVMMPFVLVLGLLVVRKIRRADLVVTFLIVSFIIILSYDAMQGFALLKSFENILLDTPTLFFAFIMLTEPLTTPPTRKLRVAYGALMGIIYVPFFHVLNIESTPELALSVGNIFSYIVSPKQKLSLTLKSSTELSPDTYDLAFQSDQKLPFKAGQYLEWTLAHDEPDSRGNRRYFTIASAPSDMNTDAPELHVGVKFYENSSSFKKKLRSLKEGDTIMASQLAGDFTLHEDPSRQLVFIAGGIGITPFTSMVKEMLHMKKQGKAPQRQITLFYGNKLEADIAYRDLFDQAQRELGMKVVHVLSGPGEISTSWRGERGFVTGELIERHVKDHKAAQYYISGPQAMVSIMTKTIEKSGVPSSHIKKDFFPGFA